MRDHDYLRAKQLLQRALIASIDRSHIETRRSILSHLASVHFELKEYDKALEAGRQSFVDTGVTCVVSICIISLEVKVWSHVFHIYVFS